MAVSGSVFQALPALPSTPGLEYRGPTPWCNWVIRSRLIAGAFPAAQDDSETDVLLSALLELGITTFVCLQAEFSLHVTESIWRSGQGLRPYIKDAQRIITQARLQNSTRIRQEKLDFLHLPIIDGHVTSDSAMNRLVDDCCLRLLKGERLYIHCWGGHGRTGTLVATMLGRLYGISAETALQYTQMFHDLRKFPQGVRSPQTPAQVAQVRRLLLDGSANVLKGHRDPESMLKLEQRPVTPQGAEDERPRPAELIRDCPQAAAPVERGIPSTLAGKQEYQDGGASRGFRFPTATKRVPITATALERSLQRHLV